MPPQEALVAPKAVDGEAGAPNAAEPPPRSLARQVLHVAYTFLSMAGWRLDHLNVPWVIGGVLSLATGQFLIIRQNNPTYTLVFFVFSLLFYYGGNSWILASKIPQRAIQRYGEDRAFRQYETVLALMFINQGLGVGAMTSLTMGESLTLPISEALAYGIGGCLFAIGLVVKVWATVVLSIDIYYYRDMFLNRRVSDFVSSGPYKVFSNPMYGIGQIHGYGYAILQRSLGGLIGIAICHVLIYVFYYSVERPFVRRVYLGGATA
jgi:protein-S-isoprenylcysteine O-methyltransferase Ste14